MNGRKIEKAVFIAFSLLIAFISNDWFQKAWSQPTKLSRWLMVIIALFFLSLAIYFILDEHGNL